MADDRLLAEVLEGLRRPRKSLPPTLFYDAAGSALFRQITTLAEYYPTRTEAAILAVQGREIARAAAAGAEGVVILEPGCGEADKVHALLAHLPARAWVGIDVATAAMALGAERLRAAFPGLLVRTVVADYHLTFGELDLPPGRRIAFFPGSTIGNFEPDPARVFLRRLGGITGEDGRVLVGVDLWKDPEVLHAAYDDARGVTAAFNRNALAHLRWRWHAEVDPEGFEHQVRVDLGLRRVEMHLRARGPQRIRLAGEGFDLADGETIHTENAYKYTLDDFAALAAGAGLVRAGAWTDPEVRFAVVLFRVDG